MLQLLDGSRRGDAGGVLPLRHALRLAPDVCR
jgi:hypothetical protein